MQSPPKSPLRTNGHLLLNLRNGLARVQTLGAGACAVENGVATVQAHGVLKVHLALKGALVARIGQPAVRLKKDSWAKVLLGVPPVGGARGRAAGAKNALVETVKLLAVGLGLAILLALHVMT